MNSTVPLDAARKHRIIKTRTKNKTGKNWPNRNAFKHGLSVRSTVGRQNTFEIEDLARAIAGASPSGERAAAARELAEAEIEYRNLEKYRLALVDAESGTASKA